MLEVIVRVNGQIVKYVYARNIDRQPRDEPSSYQIKPTNSIITHRRKDNICDLASKMLQDYMTWERSVTKQVIEFADKKMFEETAGHQRNTFEI